MEKWRALWADIETDFYKKNGYEITAEHRSFERPLFLKNSASVLAAFNRSSASSSQGRENSTSLESCALLPNAGGNMTLIKTVRKSPQRKAMIISHIKFTLLIGMTGETWKNFSMLDRIRALIFLISLFMLPTSVLMPLRSIAVTAAPIWIVGKRSMPCLSKERCSAVIS